MLKTQGTGTVSHELEEFHLNERKYTSKLNILSEIYFFILLINDSYFVIGNPNRVTV